MRVFVVTLCLSLTMLACGDSSGSSRDMDSGGAGNGASPDDTKFKPVPCPKDLPEFSIGMEAVGEEELFKVKLLDATPAPPEKFLNDWVVEVSDMDGQPVADATFPKLPQSFMPAHGHDGARPTEWEETGEPGQFTVDKINMWMGGPWEVRFWISDESGDEDYAVFRVCIED